MFQHDKKDFYSVNVEIALQANQEQRLFETQLQLHQQQQMMNANYGATNVGQQQYDQSQSGVDENQQQQMYDSQMSGPGGNQQTAADIEMQQTQLAMITEQMGARAVRYDDVYYPRTDKRAIQGNQYTYEGNNFQQMTSKAEAVQDSVNQVIVNQEIGKCPIEYQSQVSRAKIYDMKQLKPQENVRSYNALYQDSIVLSTHHEAQRYGKRSDALAKAALVSQQTVKRATYINHTAQDQQHVGQGQQQNAELFREAAEHQSTGFHGSAAAPGEGATPGAGMGQTLGETDEGTQQ